MALDAFVYCDCFEKDNLRSNAPAGVKVRVAPSGELTCETEEDSAWFAFNAWKQARACMHQGMILVHHRLGSTEAIDALRAELEKEPERFPILLQRVVYCGTHTCDWIPVQAIPRLTEELKVLNPDSFPTPVADTLRVFKIQIAELIIASNMTGKPICF